MCLISDIGQQVYSDRINKIHEYKNNMFLQVSHNLKTPLNAIRLINNVNMNLNNLEEIKYNSQ